ncbi:MAG: TRAM domain-containing protein [Opitutae bacterium]|nr:TRAM domain-containing protein [Opitutae bacterium]
MQKTILAIRLFFIPLCAVAGWLVCYTVPEWDMHRGLAAFVGFLLGALAVLVDILLKGFSLRGLSAITFGLAVGTLISHMIGVSPLFAKGDPQLVFLSQLGLFLISTYLCTVIALRGKDEFNLVIPYVRFVPHEVDVPLVVVDTSALIDGRIARVCESGFLSAVLVIPRFVLQDLQSIADSSDLHRQARGRRGLEVLNELRKIKRIEIRIVESDVAKRQDLDAKLVFVAQSMRAKLLTTDYNLAKMAEFHGVQWLNLSHLARALRPEVMVGETLQVELMRAGKEEGQAIGYLEDGSMVVVSNGRAHLGKRVDAEIVSILPSAGGKMVFARLLSEVPA